jgi:hypothetical protein
MLQETADKLLRGQSAAFECFRASWLVEVGHLLVSQFHNAFVADRHSKDVGGQILESSHSFSNLLAVNHPILLPHLIGNILKTVFFPQFVSEFGSENLRQRFHRK